MHTRFDRSTWSSSNYLFYNGLFNSELEKSVKYLEPNEFKCLD